MAVFYAVLRTERGCFTRILEIGKMQKQRTLGKGCAVFIVLSWIFLTNICCEIRTNRFIFVRKAL